MNMPVAEEYIEYYADIYNRLIEEHKFAVPICSHMNGHKLYNALEKTSHIPAGYYIPLSCIEDVESFAKKVHEKFGNKDGPPFNTDKTVIELFLHDLEHFLTDIYENHFSLTSW